MPAPTAEPGRIDLVLPESPAPAPSSPKYSSQPPPSDPVQPLSGPTPHPTISLDSLPLPLLSITSPASPLAASPTAELASAPLRSVSEIQLPTSPPPSLPQLRPRHTLPPGQRPAPGHPGGVKVPSGLAAKMAAMTKRKENTPGSVPPDRRLGPTAFLPARTPSAQPALAPSMSVRRQKPSMKLGDMGAGPGGGPAMVGGRPRLLAVGASSTPFANFSKIVDPSGRLNFGGKAVVHSNGVDFSNGSSFSINMDELALMEELGKGNYGTVQKVFHKPTKVVMAMKEIRLELDDSKLKGILTELDILHRATSDTIVEFYGAFFIESCVYYCMEYMDAGSLDKLAGADVPEPVLARVTARVVEGLRFLKDELQTMHRDVKPTNVLINRKGETKLCDFGVSGQLERSLAKTNIGCQSYMAPERIQGERTGEVTSYTVSSDVWSLGLSIVEFAIGHYPYPPETYSNIFAQLNEIVHGQSPRLPAENYSAEAQDFVGLCLRKDPKCRPTYSELLNHPFLVRECQNQVDMVKWVADALEQVKKS